MKIFFMSLLSCSVISSEKNGETLEHARGLKGSPVFLVHATGQSPAHILLISSVRAQVSSSFFLSMTGTIKGFNGVLFVLNLLFPLPLSALVSLNIRDTFFFFFFNSLD